MNTHAFSDTSVLLGRSLKHVTRSVDTIITTAVIPVAMMLLFVYVFGGAIKSGSASYVNYLLPGILLITIASGISYTAFRLFTDAQSGIFERFQSLPIARSGVMWAHVLTSLIANLISLVIVLSVAFLIGFRSGAGALDWLAVGGILFLFTLALTWIAVIPGLTASSVAGASAFSYPLIFLPFVSSAFVPTATCPARCAGSPNTSQRRRSSMPSVTCSRADQPQATPGSRSAGASASSSSPTPLPCSSISERSPRNASNVYAFLLLG